MLFNNTPTARWLRAFILTALITLPISSWAFSVALIYNEDSHYQNRFISELSAQVKPSKNLRFTKIPISSLSISALKNEGFDAIVSLDNRASEELITSNLTTTTFHALTTLARARKFAPCLPNCLKELPKHRFFVLDQPAARQLNLIRLISPTFKHIGVIITKNSENQLPALTTAAKQQGLTINEHFTDTKSMRYQINDISKSADIILAVADTDIFNASSLSQVLLTSYRHRTPIIGFSKSFIKAGAIAGVVSSMAELAKHLLETLTDRALMLTKKQHTVIHPKYYNIISNRNVAKSLNLHFPSDTDLKKKLRSNEATQ